MMYGRLLGGSSRVKQRCPEEAAHAHHPTPIITLLQPLSSTPTHPPQPPKNNRRPHPEPPAKGLHHPRRLRRRGGGGRLCRDVLPPGGDAHHTGGVCVAHGAAVDGAHPSERGQAVRDAGAVLVFAGALRLRLRWNKGEAAVRCVAQLGGGGLWACGGDSKLLRAAFPCTCINPTAPPPPLPGRASPWAPSSGWPSTSTPRSCYWPPWPPAPCLPPSRRRRSSRSAAHTCSWGESIADGRVGAGGGSVCWRLFCSVQLPAVDPAPCILSPA